MKVVRTWRSGLNSTIQFYDPSCQPRLAGKLTIENANDVDTALNATLTLDGMTISPNQTVLIVSTSW